MNRRLTPPRWGRERHRAPGVRCASRPAARPIASREQTGAIAAAVTDEHAVAVPRCETRGAGVSIRPAFIAGLSSAPRLLYAASKTRRHTSGCHFICSFSAAKNANGAGQTAPGRRRHPDCPPPH